MLLLLPVLLLQLPAFIYLPFAEAPSSVEWRFVVCSCCFRRELKKNEQQQKETRRERESEREMVEGGAAVRLRTFTDFFINARALLRNFHSTRRNEVNAKWNPLSPTSPLPPPAHTPLPIPRTRLSCQLHVDKRPRHGPTSGRQGVAGQCKD